MGVGTMSKYVSLEKEEVQMVNNTRDTLTSHIGKVGDPVAEMVWRDVLEIFDNTMEEIDDMLEMRKEFTEHMKVGMTSDRENASNTVDLFQEEVEELEVDIENSEENLVEICKAVRSAIKTESFDEETHGTLRQFVYARFNQIQQEMKEQQMEAIQQAQHQHQH